MSDTSIATIEQPSRQPPARIEGKSDKLKVTGKLRTAIEAMVWQGIARDDAARTAGLVPKSLYNAFRKHHVKAFYLAELDVLRTSARARNIHVLEEVRDQTGNQMARVNAVKALEQLDNVEIASGSHARPAGLTINIISSATPSGITIEAKPLETLQEAANE